MKDGRLDGSDIRMFRASENLSQEMAAKLFGVSRSRLRDLESGYRPPRDLHERIVAALVRYYGLTGFVKDDSPRGTSGKARFGRARKIVGEIAAGMTKGDPLRR